MVKIFPSLLALASISLTVAVPAPVPSADLSIEGYFDETMNATRVYITKEQSAAWNSQNAKKRSAVTSPDLDKHQPAFAVYYEHWDFAGAERYITYPVDGNGYYVGNEVGNPSVVPNPMLPRQKTK
ncbi:hypothetical protein AJ80_09879 [Polytolypa hystricis UAMH7299]|uniref:Uncharacterized protein n=1 Tax=Polytolypa hystricis (strain UAMH7299) TaxID=1447883 RepID=A0A2B7WHR6_POLH7|nr:hypothetical protein AJ80_09879 [Polytolypa hystricis UAMH7299]